MPAVLVTGPIVTQNSPFSPLAATAAIASTHYAYPRRDGRAELTGVAGLNIKMLYQRTATHPGTDRARCKLVLPQEELEKEGGE